MLCYRETALRLIQQWGREYERHKTKLPIFFETYRQLKARGVSFPPEDISVSNTEERGFEDGIYRDRDRPTTKSISSSETRISNGMSAISEQDELNKLNNDLDVVTEKIKLCREMLIESPGIHEGERNISVLSLN